MYPRDDGGEVHLKSIRTKQETASVQEYTRVKGR